ncbi:hypothetical protein [Microbacterium foliorum]|uniref:hypothetical protein n=1 Tax=Microbacterium foliorum TaxID=104336 RepID=UPI001D8702A9|nr:hypothetical protein [Microbacterium foliorum]CAH0186775.1 hypothetical protein SRABI03_01635 [Microbacterium foliorum]CAH0221317.1 hypothetical protein SRABI44_02422 [Microbacterium foliorum]
MNDTAVTIDEQIRAFASAVRAHLDDLPADELDEIMSGLSADLADQAADNDGVLELGDPAAYAEELRSAAGLPPRSEDGQRLRMRDRFATWRAATAASIRGSAFGAWLLDLLIALRPVWWVLRGIAMFALIVGTPLGAVMPLAPMSWLIGLALVIVSVQWGRGLWLPQNWLRHMRTVVSVVAVVMLPFVLALTLTPRVEYVGDEYSPQGLMLDGVQINNIFAYDEDGNPIDRVQLFTGKGTPLDLYGASGGANLFSTEDGAESQFGLHDDGLTATVPVEDYRGKPLWNIYPLDETDVDTDTFQPDTSRITRPEPPFTKAPSIESAQESPTPSPQPTETPVP